MTDDIFSAQGYSLVSINGSSIRQYTNDRATRCEGDRDVDPSATLGSSTSARQDAARAGSSVAHCPRAATLRFTRPHAVCARRFPATFTLRALR